MIMREGVNLFTSLPPPPPPLGSIKWLFLYMGYILMVEIETLVVIDYCTNFQIILGLKYKCDIKRWKSPKSGKTLL